MLIYIYIHIEDWNSWFNESKLLNLEVSHVFQFELNNSQVYAYFGASNRLSRPFASSRISE